MSQQNKIILAISLTLALIVGAMLINLNNKIKAFKEYATYDVSSSTIKVMNGTSTQNIPLTGVLMFYGQEIFCLKNPTVEGCAVATSTQNI